MYGIMAFNFMSFVIYMISFSKERIYYEIYRTTWEGNKTQESRYSVFVLWKFKFLGEFVKSSLIEFGSAWLHQLHYILARYHWMCSYCRVECAPLFSAFASENLPFFQNSKFTLFEAFESQSRTSSWLQSLVKVAVQDGELQAALAALDSIRTIEKCNEK